MTFNSRYDEILASLPQYDPAWTELFSGFGGNTLLRINFIVKSSGRYFFSEEIDRARGPYTSWLYVNDEWSCLSLCLGPDFNIYHCFNNPPDMRNVLEITMDRLSFDLNSSLIYNTLQGVHFSPFFVRREQAGIDMVNTFMLFDFGDNGVKTELMPEFYKNSAWLELPYSGSFPMYEQETMMKAVFLQ